MGGACPRGLTRVAAAPLDFAPTPHVFLGQFEPFSPCHDLSRQLVTKLLDKSPYAFLCFLEILLIRVLMTSSSPRPVHIQGSLSS